MTKNVIKLFACTLVLFVICSCSESKDEATGPDPGPIEKEVVLLPERSPQVYVGLIKEWHKLTDPTQADKWSYVTSNATGFYTSFLDMWVMHYQNGGGETALVTCQKLRKIFKTGNCFFEGSMETSVNSGTQGFNNEVSDKRNLDFLTNAGFNVVYTSLNYMGRATTEELNSRIALYRTYKGSRTCLSLAAPWYYNGNLVTDMSEASVTARRHAKMTDGIQTDGPLGFWYTNKGLTREGSCSVVKFANLNKQISAIMLAPYGASVIGYDPLTDFLKLSKECVLFHEDRNADPTLWTIWTYGAAMPAFPESAINADGEEYAMNTSTGVAYWLLKHLNNLPKVGVQKIVETNTDVKLVKKSDTEYEVEIATGKQAELVFDVSNDIQPQIEISPIIRAILDTEAANWQIKFTANGADVTNKVVYEGGLICIKDLRLSKGKRLKLNMQIKPKNPSALPTTIQIQSMSNISNTNNNKIAMSLKFKAI